MKKTIYILISLIILFLIYSGLNPPIITPEGYFHVSKEERLKIIENLNQDCSSENPIYLISTYSDVYNDKNASSCWTQYMRECQKKEMDNRSLKIPITCPTY